MLFDGHELLEILSRTAGAIELQIESGRYVRHLTSVEALALDLDLFVGIGNRRRIRFLRRRAAKFVLNAGSKTTQRLTGQGELNISHPSVRQHRSAWS